MYSLRIIFTLKVWQRDQTSGIVVKLVLSTSVAWGSQVQIPDVDLHAAHQAMLLRHPAYKIEGDSYRGTIFL